MSIIAFVLAALRPCFPDIPLTYRCTAKIGECCTFPLTMVNSMFSTTVFKYEGIRSSWDMVTESRLYVTDALIVGDDPQDSWSFYAVKDIAECLPPEGLTS